MDWILNNNLHGIDIDNRTVQIGAAALYIKTQEKMEGYKIEKLNLVASDLGLSHLSKDDPGVLTFTSTLEEELGIHREISYEIINTLKGAEYLGSLLQVDKEIDRIVKSYRVYNQAEDLSVVRAKIFKALTHFIHNHDQGEDLGVRSLAEQLGKGLRLIELLGQKYDVVVANPPYLGIAKARKEISEQIVDRYPDSKTDLYGVFIERGMQLILKHGFIAMVTMQNFMFLSSFDELRQKIIRESRISCVAHLGAYTFQELRDHALAVAFVLQHGLNKSDNHGIYQRYLVPKTKDGCLVNQHDTYNFPQSRFAEIPGSPMIYWWPEEFRKAYLKAPKLNKVGETRQGLASSNNNRFLRKIHEVKYNSLSLVDINSNHYVSKNWEPYVKGASGKRWYEAVSDIIIWNHDGLEVKTYASFLYGSASRTIKSQDKYFKNGISYSFIGTNGFLCRLRKYKSIFDVSGSSIFCANPEKMQVILSSSLSGYVSQSINPTVNNQVGDIANLPVLDQLKDYTIYLKRAEALYDKLFVSTESNLEYTYENLSPEEFEIEEARIRDEIDKELFTQFSEETITAIYKEIGPSPFNFPQWNKTDSIIPKDFTEAYQTTDSILTLSHKYNLHPDSILQIKDTLGLIHQGQRKDKAFKNLSWAIGVLLGRFDAQTGGLADLSEKCRQEQSLSPDPSATKAHPHGLLYLSILDDHEGLNRPESQNVGKGCLKFLKDTLSYKWGEEKSRELWSEIDNALVLDCRTDWTAAQQSKKNLNNWIRTSAFAMHQSLYQKRPIYFPLVSAKKNFFIWVNIHKWNNGTLNAVLANYLNPDIFLLKSRIQRLREELHAMGSGDTRQINNTESEIATLGGLIQ